MFKVICFENDPPATAIMNLNISTYLHLGIGVQWAMSIYLGRVITVAHLDFWVKSIHTAALFFRL